MATEIIEPGAFAKFTDTRMPIVFRGEVVGTALISEDGEIINAELDDATFLATGIRVGAVKSISITPNYNAPMIKENDNGR